jgi:hypothetical protein
MAKTGCWNYGHALADAAQCDPRQHTLTTKPDREQAWPLLESRFATAEP